MAGHPSGLTFLQLVRADIEATTHPNFRLYSATRFWTRALAKLLVSSNVRVVVTYRIANACARRGLLPVALWLRERGIRKSGAELNPLATIGPGLYLAHSIGVGVGAYVTIGRNCTLHLGSVLGPQAHGTGSGPHTPQPTVLGDDVFVGTHAVIVGGITVGDGAVIGANAVVLRDVAPGTVVSASPARVVGQRDVTAS